MNHQMPLVSVIMPAYNASAYIRKSIESVIGQSYNCWQLIVANDASTDETLAIAQAIADTDDRIEVVSLEENGGAAKARNLALENARGKYIAFLDSDDYWYPEKLTRQIEFMETENVTVSYTCYRRVDEHEHAIGEVHPPSKVTYSDMLKSNFIGILTGIYNAEKLGIHKFEDLKYEDYVAWLSLVKMSGQARLLDEVLADYRVHEKSVSANKFRALRWQWHIYRSNQHMNLLKSVYYLMFYIYYGLKKRI
jgi:glycosyltransferase involved in cell wall biosynthesis